MGLQAKLDKRDGAAMGRGSRKVRGSTDKFLSWGDEGGIRQTTRGGGLDVGWRS